MTSKTAALAGALLALLAFAACEGDDGGAGTGAAFDAGTFDGSSGPGTDGASPGDASGDGGMGDGGDKPPPPTPDDVYVDPAAGLDTNSGKAGAPFKTISKALATVPSGSGVHLLDGTYNAASEGPSAGALAIPNGVILRAENPGQPRIVGLTLAANEATGGIYGVTLDVSAVISARSTAPSQIIVSGVTFLNEMTANTTLTVGGLSKVTVTNLVATGVVRTALTVADDAEVVMNGGTIDAANALNTGGLVAVTNRGALTLNGTALKNARGPGVSVSGTTVATPAKLTLQNNALIDGVGTMGSSDCSGSVVVSPNTVVVVDHSTIKGSPNAGLCVRDGGTNVKVTVQNGSVIASNASGIVAGAGTTTTADVTVANATITGNTNSGVSWLANGTFSLHDSTISGNTAGCRVTGGAGGSLTFTARNNQIETNGLGVQAFGTNAGDTTLDLGTAASPGGNTFTGNTTAGVSFSAAAGVVGDAQGNTWNANEEGADGAGHYAAGTTMSGPVNTGLNYRLPGAGGLNL